MSTAYLGLVEQFHKTFHYRYPTPTIPDMSPELLKNRTAYLAEEFKEYLEAFKTNDRVEMLDGLVDMQYILSGTVLACGIVDEFDAYAFDEPDADEPEINKWQERIQISIFDMSNAVSFKELAALCYDVQDAVMQLASAHGLLAVFDAAFIEVHESNIRKLWSDEEVEFSPMPYSFTQTDGGWIATDSTGKIKKPSGWTPPNLKQFITA